MKKEIIMKNVSSVLSRTKIGLRKYGPDILVVAGIAGTIASTVLACRATTKLSTILDESKENVETIHKCADDENMKDKYSKDDAKKDLAIVYVHTCKTGKVICAFYCSWSCFYYRYRSISRYYA